MKKALACMVMVAVVFGMVCVAYASMDDDAKAIAQKIASFIKDNGKDKGVAEVMNPADKFKRGKLFNVSVQDFNGVNLANVQFPALIGQNHYTMRDATGKLWIQKSIEIAKTKGSGSFDLSFTSPESKKVVPWKGFVQRVEGQDLLVMVLYETKK
jgi:cytochrome c